MKLHRLILSATLLLAGVSPARAETISPAEVAEKILEASPATHADKLGIASLSESLKTESNLPDPEIEGEYLFASGNETNRWGAGISWGLEWPGVYAARRKDTARKMAAAEAAAAVARRDRLIEVKRLLLDYVLAEKQLQVLNGIKSVNDSIMMLSQQAEKQGEITRLDINKLRLEQATLNASVSALAESRAETVMRLNLIYGEDPTPLLSAMTCEFPEICLPAEDVDYLSSPQVVSARANAEAAKEALKTARAEGLPGLSVGYQHAFEDGAHFNGATLGISIPLFSSRGKKAAAKAAIAEAEFKAEQAAKDAKTEFEGAGRRLVILLKQIGDMSSVVEDEDNAGWLLKAYRGGIMTLIDYLNERNYFTNATLDLLALRHSAANLLLDIEAMTDDRRR